MELRLALAKIQAEINALPKIDKRCRYRLCRKEFQTDDGRVEYCCGAHYKMENKARTLDKNATKKLTTGV
jgi:hypothetical protein